MQARNGEGRLSKGPLTESPLTDQYKNFEQTTVVLTSCYKPTFITIAARGSSAQYGEVAVFFVCQFLLSRATTACSF
jgi:hypothetical protein